MYLVSLGFALDFRIEFQLGAKDMLAFVDQPLFNHIFLTSIDSISIKFRAFTLQILVALLEDVEVLEAVQMLFTRMLPGLERIS